jgi:hypothetical protein
LLLCSVISTYYPLLTDRWTDIQTLESQSYYPELIIHLQCLLSAYKWRCSMQQTVEPGNVQRYDIIVRSVSSFWPQESAWLISSLKNDHVASSARVLAAGSVIWLSIFLRHNVPLLGMKQSTKRQQLCSAVDRTSAESLFIKAQPHHRALQTPFSSHSSGNLPIYVQFILCPAAT